MVNTPAPFVEKMTLFWHGHFATSGDKVSIQNVATELNLARLQVDELRLIGQSDFARSDHAYLVGYRPKQKRFVQRKFRVRSDGALHTR